jgi:putative hydrolase of the HAD superfamily
VSKIFFDFDGVLVRSQLPDKKFIWQQNILKDHGISQKFMGELFSPVDWSEILCGRGDFREKIAQVIQANGYSISTDEFIEYWLSRDLNWYPDILTFAKSLKERGHSLYIASNQEHLRATNIRGLVEIKSIFEKVFTSSDVGVAKPNVDFFSRIREQEFVRSSEEFIFIDDSEANVAAAATDGWKAVHFKPDFNVAHDVDYLRARLSFP